MSLASSLLLVLAVGGPARRLALLLFLACLLAWASWRGGTDSRRPGDWNPPG
ncbi:MAG TPA: hypothetical protein VNO79_05485 [Actinomycetota bacterium]|nr:hypothetical protein [Actinomycetota bacterium]